jgi:hypothetical protein
MSVTHLIDNINAMAETLPSLEESERRQLLQACDKLKNKFESPFELASRLVFSVCRVRFYMLGDLPRSDGADRAIKQ